MTLDQANAVASPLSLDPGGMQNLTDHSAVSWRAATSRAFPKPGVNGALIWGVVLSACQLVDQPRTLVRRFIEANPRVTF